MTDEVQTIELKVETHLSGRWTLVARQGPGIFQQRDGELCANDDAVAFYRAVAVFMGTLGSAGVRFLYEDASL